MHSLKILTFNWHDPYIYLFGQTGHDIHVCDWMRRADGTTGWDYAKRPLRDNLTLIKDPADAVAGLERGDFDVAVAHTLQDIRFLEDHDLPAVFLTHNALHNDGQNNAVAMKQIRLMVSEFTARPDRVFAAISPMKLNSWQLEGHVIRPGIDIADYGGWTGETAAALAVGNLFVERDFMLGYSFLSEALADLPHQYVGENPSLPGARKAENWDDLKAFYRSHRVYANATVEAFEDGYNLGMLEAMATGMPVVTAQNATSPVADGRNGYVCATPADMRDRVTELLVDESRAHELGQAARRTVETDFSVDAFVDSWNATFDACLGSGAKAPVGAGTRAFDLAVAPEDTYAYGPEDVARFMAKPSNVVVARAKVDRYDGFLCIDFILANTETGEQAVWNGFWATLSGEKLTVDFPPYLTGLRDDIKGQLERILIECIKQVLTSDVPDDAQVHIQLGGAPDLIERVGNDRITPGNVRADVYLHHAKRYGFASQFCDGKDVVDIASGTGYGSRILSRKADSVVAVDLEAAPLAYGRLTFDRDNIRRVNADMRSIPLAENSADTAVCFEAIEHITEHRAFLEEAARVVRPNGTFIVSTPNLDIYGTPEFDNPYHVGMLDKETFTRLLEEYFDDVTVIGQERAYTDRRFYDFYNLTDDPTVEEEIHIAICSGVRKRDGKVNGAANGKAPEIGANGHGRVAVGNDRKLVAPLKTQAASEDVERLKILFAQVSNPVSAGRSFVDTLRTAHDVVTCGPALDASAMEGWLEAERQHALKRDHAGEAEKLELMLRLAEPNDVPLEAGPVDVDAILQRLPDGWRPDLFVWADNAAGFLPTGLNRLGCPTVGLIGDTHTGQMQWRIDYAKSFTHPYLMFTRHHIADFEAAGVQNVGWLPAACDPRFHGKFDVAKAFDIGFIGQTHPQWHAQRVALLQRLVDAGFDVQVDGKILEEMSLFHSRSRIVFNRSLNLDLNRRVFEALCSGSMLLTDRLPEASGLESLFTDREHLVLYGDDDLESLAAYYLKHEGEREAIAARGREEALARHTYAARANAFLTDTVGASAAVCTDPGVEAPEPTAAPVRREVVEVPAKSDPNPDAPTFSSAEEIDAFLSAWEGPVRLNLGCGPDNRAGYVNVDAWVDNADLKMDIFALPLPNGSVDEILSSHMLEHLGKFEVPKALQGWHRVLKPAGKLCLNLPDLEWSAQQWVDLPEDARWGWPLDTLFGLQTHPGEYHKTGFTAARIEAILRQIGFASVETSWAWSHGLRCIRVEASREGAATSTPADLQRFTSQFVTDLSDLVPYTADDVNAFLVAGGWRVGYVSFERLPMDGNIYTINVALRAGDRQLVLQCLRLFGADSNPVLWFPSYLQATPESDRAEIGDKVAAAFRAMVNDPNFRDGQFVFANFGEDGDLGLEVTGERVIPGLTDMSLYIPHVKRYLFAKTFCDGKRVLDAGCGTGYGSKLLSQVAASVHGVDVDERTLAFCARTYKADNLTWAKGDVRNLEIEGGFDVVTSFEVIEHLEREDIPSYLEGIRKALADDGVALISTPNRLVAQQWDNPHHHTEMTREEFVRTLSEFFDVESVVGQVTWTQDREVPGQSYLTRMATDDDDMYVAVCRPLPVPSPLVRAGEPSARQNEVREDVRAAQPEHGESTRPADAGSCLVDVVIPVFNKAEYTKACLESLERTRGETAFRIIVVDNGSTDGTAELLDAWSDRATIVRPGENLGFAKGNNLGASHGTSPFVLFLNNDTVAEPGWLDRLAETMTANPDVGIAGPKLLYPNRTIQHAGIEIIEGVPDHVHRHAKEDDPAAIVSRDLDMVTGACLMIRRDLFETVGGFDDRYVNGVEDIDLCLRVRDRGFRVLYVAESVLQHHEGMSDGRYDHVEPNLQKFVQRFQGRFDGRGRFVPVIDSVEQADDRDTRPLRGIWEGTQFVRHSLSIVNAAMAGQLLTDERVELRLIPYETPTFGPDEDPGRYGPIASALQHRLSGPPDFHIRHKWPPDLAAPASGHWIMFQPWEFGRIPQAWVKPIQDRVDEVWAYSFYVKQCYVDSGIDPDRVQVVPLGVDHERFNPTARPLDLKTDKSFKFLFVGGTIYRKGIDILLNAYREAFSANDDVCLVLKGVGEDTFYKGQTAGDLIRQIQSDPAAPEIIYMTEELSDEAIAGLYTACDCLVHPYRGEGFGMPVAEAMACDLPVIVTKGGSTDDFCVEDTAYLVEADRRDIAFNEETAGQTWLFEPRVASLIEQMKFVRENTEEAAEKGRRGGEYVRENLTWKHSSDRAVERLEAVCAEPVRRTITLAGVDGSLGGNTPEPTAAQASIDCILIASDAPDSRLAGHSRERFTEADLATRNVVVGDTPGPTLNAELAGLSSDFVLLLREDAIVTEGWLRPLTDVMAADDSVGIAVPSCANGRGEQAVAPKYRSKKKELQRFARRHRSRFEGQVVDVDAVSAACVMIRRELLIGLGGFEATFRTDAFIDDLVRRAAQKGYRTVCARESYVHVEPAEPSLEEARERKAVRHLAQGDAHRVAGEHDEALARYREALDLKDDYVEAALVCSATLLEMDRPEEAAEPFATLAERYPDSARIQNYLGRCLFRAGQVDEAKARFEQALTLMPAFAEAEGNLAVLLWEQGRLDEAVEHMSRAAEIAPNDPDTLFNIGMIYAQLGQGSEAIEALAGYLTLSPEDNDTRVHLAALLIDNERENEGVAELERVLTEDPEHEDAIRVLRQLEVLVAANDGTQGA